MRSNLLVVFFVVSTACLGSSAYSDETRQRYSEWLRDPMEDRFYRIFYFKPTPDFEGYKYHLCYYFPDFPTAAQGFYFFNAETKKFWGRANEIEGKMQYSVLAPDAKTGDFRELPNLEFPDPQPMDEIPLPERAADDDTTMEPVPSDIADADALTLPQLLQNQQAEIDEVRQSLEEAEELKSNLRDELETANDEAESQEERADEAEKSLDSVREAHMKYKAVVLLDNRTAIDLKSPKIHWQLWNGEWTEWEELPMDKGYRFWRSQRGAIGCCVKFDRVGGDGEYTEKEYLIDYDRRSNDWEVDIDKILAIHYFKHDGDVLDLHSD